MVLAGEDEVYAGESLIKRRLPNTITTWAWSKHFECIYTDVVAGQASENHSTI